MWDDNPTCPALCCASGLPSFQPAATWKGWDHSSWSISAQKGSNVPSGKGVAVAWAEAQSLQAAACAAWLHGSLLGFLKGKTCQLCEGGQQNDGNEPELVRIAKV